MGPHFVENRVVPEKTEPKPEQPCSRRGGVRAGAARAGWRRDRRRGRRWRRRIWEARVAFSSCRVLWRCDRALTMGWYSGSQRAKGYQAALAQAPARALPGGPAGSEQWGQRVAGLAAHPCWCRKLWGRWTATTPADARPGRSERPALQITGTHSQRGPPRPSGPPRPPRRIPVRARQTVRLCVWVSGTSSAQEYRQTTSVRPETLNRRVLCNDS